MASREFGEHGYTGALPARMKNCEQTENSSAVGSSTPAESDGGRGSAVNRLT